MHASGGFALLIQGACWCAGYPAVFAAGAVVAGLPVGAVSTSPMALLRMHRADPFSTRIRLAAAVCARTSPRGHQPWPRLSIWQGEHDRTVDPENAEILAAQWAELHGCADEPSSETTPIPQARHRVWVRRGVPAMELWTLPEMRHGFPIAPGLGKAGPWVLEAGVSAVWHISGLRGIARERG